MQTGAALRGVGVQRAAAPQMVGVPLANFDGEKVGAKPVELKVAKSGAYIVQRKVVAEQANMRLGTAKTKTRTEVRGGAASPTSRRAPAVPARALSARRCVAVAACSSARVALARTGTRSR